MPAGLVAAGSKPENNPTSTSQHPLFPATLPVLQGKQHYLLYCLTPAMKPRMLMTGAPCASVPYLILCRNLLVLY